jgi:predicted oxidoreductase
MVLPSLPLSSDGPVCSRLAMGAWRMAAWNMDTDAILGVIQTCVDWGITTFDHADIYGDYQCERLFGDAIARQTGLRDRLQLISKCNIRLVSPHRPQHRLHHYDSSREHILASVDQSLKHLRTDYLDVLLLHRPDPLMDADDVAEAFTTLKQAGKVRYFGVSNFMPSQVNLLLSRLSFPLVTNQLQISVQHLDAFLDGTLDQCQQLRMTPMAWSPLGGGTLFQGTDAQSQRLLQALIQVGEEIGAMGADQVALAWLLTHPASIMPVLGTKTIERIQRAIAAVDLRLTREQWFTIWTASTGMPVP